MPAHLLVLKMEDCWVRGSASPLNILYGISVICGSSSDGQLLIQMHKRFLAFLVDEAEIALDERQAQARHPKYGNLIVLIDRKVLITLGPDCNSLII